MFISSFKNLLYTRIIYQQKTELHIPLHTGITENRLSIFISTCVEINCILPIFKIMGCGRSKNTTGATRAEQQIESKIHEAAQEKSSKKLNNKILLVDPGLLEDKELSSFTSSDRNRANTDKVDEEKPNHQEKITVTKLKKMRDRFWGSKLENDPSGIWNSLNLISTMLLDGDIDKANIAMVENSLSTTDKKSLESCSYRYSTIFNVPRFCFARPQMLHEDDEETLNQEKITQQANGFVFIRVRLSHNCREFVLSIGKDWTVIMIKREVQIYASTKREKNTEVTEANTCHDIEDIPPVRQKLVVLGEIYKDYQKLNKLDDTFFFQELNPIINRKTKVKPIQIFVLPKAEYDSKNRRKSKTLFSISK